MFKKYLRVFSFALAGLLLSFGLAACSSPLQPQSAQNSDATSDNPELSSDEADAKAVVDQFVSDLVNSDDEKAEQILGQSLSDVLNKAGINPKELLSALFGHLDAKVTSVTIDGIEARCELEFSNADLPQAFKNYASQINEWAATTDLTALVNEGEDALPREMIKILIENINSGELETPTKNVTALLIQNPDGSWRLENTDALEQAFLMGANLSTLF